MSADLLKPVCVDRVPGESSFFNHRRVPRLADSFLSLSPFLSEFEHLGRHSVMNKV